MLVQQQFAFKGGTAYATVEWFLYCVVYAIAKSKLPFSS